MSRALFLGILLWACPASWAKHVQLSWDAYLGYADFVVAARITSVDPETYSGVIEVVEPFRGFPTANRLVLRGSWDRRHAGSPVVYLLGFRKDLTLIGDEGVWLVLSGEALVPVDVDHIETSYSFDGPLPATRTALIDGLCRIGPPEQMSARELGVALLRHRAPFGPPERAIYTAWIAALAHPDFAVREVASRALAQATPAALDWLRAEAARTTDLEIRTRLAGILETFRMDALASSFRVDHAMLGRWASHADAALAAQARWALDAMGSPSQR